MSQKKVIEVNKDNVEEIINELLYSCRTKTSELDGAKYHHNISYQKAAKAIKEGILSLEEEYRLHGKVLTPDQKIKFSREGGHINGVDEISLSSMDIDFEQLYRDERLFDPYSSYVVDIVISSRIKAYRITEHYVNEYLTGSKISNEDFKAVDVRILKHIREQLSDERINQAISYYNYLYDIAAAILNENLYIPLREMSDENIALDKNKVLELPKIILK